MKIIFFQRGNWSGIDARRNLERAGDEVAGKYLTNVYTDEAVKIIENHDHQQPLFLELSHAAVHAIKYATTNLPVPDVAENNRKFSYIRDERRRLYAGNMGIFTGLKLGRVFLLTRSSFR